LDYTADIFNYYRNSDSNPFYIWCNAGHWDWPAGLDFVAIMFIAWGAIVHLSDRLGRKQDAKSAICRGGDHMKLYLLTQLFVRRKLGWLSVIFFVSGMIFEFVKLASDVVNHAQ
jgi:hypothetical protein